MADGCLDEWAEIDGLRAFNRIYTQKIGVLEEHLLGSGFTLAEARVLYELSEAGTVSAAELARRLGLDPAYLSRILQKLRGAGLLGATPNAEDKRRSDLSLTTAGEAAYAPLKARSRDAMAALLDGLPAERRRAFIEAAGALRTILDAAPARSAAPTLREPEPGDIGRIIARHGRLYAEEYGFDQRFEGLVAEIAGGFLRHQDRTRERCWVAEVDGRLAGSIFLARTDDEKVAKIRLLYVEPTERGAGLGRCLLDACLAFAREAGYAEIVLWTNDVLTAARRLYETAGFTLVSEEPHTMFGPAMKGQVWRRALR